MSDNKLTTLNTHTFGHAVGSSALERNRVLRNTYMLLAVSLVPTVLGAYLGVSTGLFRAFTGVLGFVMMLAIAFGFIYAINRTKQSKTGVYVLLGFTFFMGLLLSSLIARILGFQNSPSLIMTAFGGTAGVFFLMGALATTIKRNLSGLGTWLFWGVAVLILGSVINLFVGSTVGMAVISTLSIAIFSAYMLYDIKQVIDGGETNYITATLSIYLDLINVFQSLLSLLGLFGGSRE